MIQLNVSQLANVVAVLVVAAVWTVAESVAGAGGSSSCINGCVAAGRRGAGLVGTTGGSVDQVVNIDGDCLSDKKSS